MSFVDNFFRAGRINTLLGNPDEGKTNLAVYFGQNLIKYGYTILSNIAFFKPENIAKAKELGYLKNDINYEPKPEQFKYIPVASQLLLEACKGDKNVVIIDEAGVVISSSRAMSESVLQFKFLGFSIRKLGACPILIAQDKQSVVPSLRKTLVDYEVQVHRRSDDRRDITFLKSHKFFNQSTGDYEIKFKHHDDVVNVPPATIPFDSVHPGGFTWNINLAEFYNMISLSGYDSIEIKKHAPRLINNLVAERKIDEFMKRKKFMRTGSAADFLKVSTVTIRNWADEGKINCIKDVKGNRLFSRSEVTRLAIEKGLI